MRAVFPKAAERATARFDWDRGFYAEMPIYSNHGLLPHDLAHYAVDAILRPRYGFWELAAQRAPFKSLEPSRPWPRDRVAWFARLLRDHRDEMVEAERFPSLLSVGWPEAQRLLKQHWSDWPGTPGPSSAEGTTRRCCASTPACGTTGEPCRWGRRSWCGGRRRRRSSPEPQSKPT